MNVALAAPFTVTPSSASPSVSPSGPSYTVQVFLSYRGGSLAPSKRVIAEKPTYLELVSQLASPVTDEEAAEGYTSSVPSDLVLKPTTQGHEYVVSSKEPLSSTAQIQIACTLDMFWVQNPGDGLWHSTHLIIPGVRTSWDDCPAYLGVASLQDIAPSPKPYPTTPKTR